MTPSFPLKLLLRPRLVLHAVATGMAAVSGVAISAAAETAPPVATVREAFARWPELKTDDVPVSLEGVVTGTMPSGAFRLHDGDLGIYVTKAPTTPKLSPGDRVQVSGVLRQGGYSPWMSPHKISVLGRGAYPEAKSATYSLLESGAADNQWLEIEGVVQAAQVLDSRDFVMLVLGMTGGNLRVLVNYEPDQPYDTLVDAAVRLRGVAAVNVNKHHHVVEPSFRVPSFSEITVLTPGRADPFAQATVTSVRSLMKFSPGVTRRHRVITRGVVLRRLSDTTLFVRNEDLGLKVETTAPVNFRAGDLIEAAGFPVMTDGMAVLDHSIARLVERRDSPRPVTPKIGALLDGSMNSDLVSVQARLIDWAVAGRSATLIFESGGQHFKGFIDLAAAKPEALPPKNSLVNVTGICVINELEDLWFYQPRSFMLLVADLADLELLRPPPWWTAERLWWALAISCSVLLAVVGWVWALRRQIERKRSVIEQQARHAAALEERSRIARELHDTLEQGLTGLSLQMKAMETDLGASPQAARSRLMFARQMLRQSRALARNAIRELRTDTSRMPVEGLVEGLKHVADSWNSSGALAATVQVTGQPRSLPSRLEHHLLRIGTEAMTNAVKHGRAATIAIEVNFQPAQISLRIQDDGVGFEPAEHLERTSGCFGLLGMRERAREVEGELLIDSRPGFGTDVRVNVPHATEPSTARTATVLLSTKPLPAEAT